MATPTLTPERMKRLRPAVKVGSPPFNPGDHLSRAEFERLYEAHPEIKKAELIEGVVYMPSPAHAERHGRPHNSVNTWLGVYTASTPGVYAYDNATVQLDMENEVQPDALLRLGVRFGGHSRVTSDDYLAGAPELVVEVAASSWAYDFHGKRRIYARNGVQEYLVVQPLEQQVVWFVLRGGVYETLTPDANGVLRSEVFTGLWLPPAALWSGDLAGLLAVLQEGLDSAEHAAFVGHLATAAKE